MIKLEIQGHKVNICRDIIEWGREFYGIPEDAKRKDIENVEELESECMGFADPEGKEIWLFIPQSYSVDDLSSTIAHELGHVAEPFKASKCAHGGKHDELQAEHYEDFYMLVNKIVNEVICSLNPR